MYWYSRVTWLIVFVGGSSYVSFPGSLRLCIHFVAYFVSEMSDFLLGALGYCPFHHYVRSWCDFTPCLIWVDHHSFWCYSLHYHRPRFRFWFVILTSPLILFLPRPISGLIFPSYHHYISHYQFDLLHLFPHWHHIHIRHPQVQGSQDFLYMLHFTHEGMGFDHWVFELSFPSFLSPYHPSLHYVPCLKTTLRPWDQISSSTTSMWTSVWDSVDIQIFAMHLLLGDISQMFRSVSTVFGLPGSRVWWGMIRCHLFFLVCRTSDAILGHIPFRRIFMDFRRGHMF